MRASKEYILCKQIATYLRLQYPKVIFHFDLSGLNHSKAQAGQTKIIQHGRGWPDLFIAEARTSYHGLFLELKAEGTRIYKKDGSFSSPHIAEQDAVLKALASKGYQTWFAVGFSEAQKIIDAYMKVI
jgi:hypothetical protein